MEKPTHLGMKKGETSKCLNILIPVYNEAENFKQLYNEIKSKVLTPHKIFIIYDFEADNTLPIIRDLQKEDSLLVLVKNMYGRGVLNAIKTGFSSFSEGPALVMMADLSDDLSKVDMMMEKYHEGYQVVCASRYMKGGKQLGGPILKRILSRWAGISLHYLLGIPTHDITNNFRLYDKTVLNEIDIESKGGFEIAMELTVKAFKRGYAICEVPATWRDRKAGESKFKLLRWLPNYVKWYLYAIKG